MRPTDHEPLIVRLGHAGLIPFALLALTVWLLERDLQSWAALAMASYAGLIASFLGGVHWGALWLREAQHQGAQPRQHVPGAAILWWGVTPSLLAWPGVLMPPHAGLVWQGLVLLTCYLVDRRLYPQLGLEHWLTLRFRLSGGAALSCFIAAGAL